MKKDKEANGPGPNAMIFNAFSKFEEKSFIDQDDSYGNYRPSFEVKNHKVTGRTEDIMKL